LHYNEPMIAIHAYDARWPRDFEQIRGALVAVLGEAAVRVDHIGSTAVPGLGAKDVIDVQVTVRALTTEIRDQLVDAGFRHCVGITADHVPDGEDPRAELWAKLLFNEPAGQRRANIHVRVAGHPNQRYPLLFRDYLRAHPHSASSIERIKRGLAKYHAEDVEAYYDIKDPVYDLIWDAAKGWERRAYRAA
jgi:GrpB-like predicted nucleotidyltransferase (UPF0157 family)